MKLLKPIILSPSYYSGVESEIQSFFDSEIFRPLFRVINRPMEELLNDKDPLLEAIRQGHLYHADGSFYGTFNATLSRRLRDLGARFNSVTKTFTLDKNKIPAELRTAQAVADNKFDELRRSLVYVIDEMDIDQAYQKYGFTEKYEAALERMDKKFHETVAGITIPPSFTPEQKKIIAHDYSNNLRLYIKKWSANSIITLREDVTQNALIGHRAENMVKMIQGEYGVSRRKARFLARQETSLLMSKFREVRYKDVGIQKYRWSGINDGRERPDHIALNGTLQRFDSPPIVDKKTGRRGNPGEDYECRCTARPVFEGYE